MPGAEKAPTRRWVLKTVEQWRNRLGLHEWEITLNWDEQPEGDAYADVWRPDDYLRASIRLRSDWPEQTRRELECTLAHEVAHLLMRELSRANDLSFDRLGESEQAIALAAWKHAEEQTVDRLARALVRSWPAS